MNENEMTRLVAKAISENTDFHVVVMDLISMLACKNGEHFLIRVEKTAMDKVVDKID